MTGNLHTGNIVLAGETAKILNVTAVVGGLSSRVRALAVQVKVTLTSYIPVYILYTLPGGCQVCGDL